MDAQVKRHEPLYLKHRPQALDQLVGQSAVTRTLTNAINFERLSHAYLFTGPRGTGKTSTARILAKSLNCKAVDKATVTPCQQCASCLEIKNGNSPAVFEIDAASNNSVDDARVLIERAPLMAPGGRYKIYIIDECHMLTKEAFNALLKTIEDPPPNVVFILATTEEHKVLPTIVSRCQRLMFRLATQDDLLVHLRNVATTESIEITDRALDFVARRSGGGLRDALGLLDQSSLLSSPGNPVDVTDLLALLGALHEDVLLEMSEHVLHRRGQELLGSAGRLLQEGREPATVVQELARHFLNLAKASYLAGAPNRDASASEMIIGSPNYLNGLFAQAPQFERSELTQLVEALDRLEQACRRTTQPAMHLEVGLLALCHRQDMLLVRELGDRVASLERALSGGTPAPRPVAQPRPPASAPAAPAYSAPAQATAPAPAPAPAYSAPALREQTAQAPALQGQTAQAPALHEQTAQAPALQGQTAQAPALQGQTAQAPALQGQTAQAPALQGQTVQAPALQGQTAQAPALQGQTAQAPALQGQTAQAPALQGQTVPAPAASPAPTSTMVAAGESPLLSAEAKLADTAVLEAPVEQSVSNVTLVAQRTIDSPAQVAPKVEEPAPAPTPPASSPHGDALATPDEVDRVWSKLLDELQRRHIPTFSLISVHAVPLSLSATELSIGTKENFVKTLEGKLDHIKAAACTVVANQLNVRIRPITTDIQPHKPAAKPRERAVTTAAPAPNPSAQPSSDDDDYEPAESAPPTTAPTEGSRPAVPSTAAAAGDQRPTGSTNMVAAGEDQLEADDPSESETAPTTSTDAATAPSPVTVSTGERGNDATIIKEAYKLFEGPGSRQIGDKKK